MKWTHTVETVVEVEQAGAKGQWRIGDAIEKDFSGAPGAPREEIPRAVYGEVADRLAEKGYDKYSSQYLGRLHQASQAFPRQERDDRYSWAAHAEAGTPANLKKAVAALRQLDRTVTKYNVRDLVAHWRSEAIEKRRKEHEAAKAKKAKAKADKVEATKERLAAKDKAKREAAEGRRQAAIQKMEEASKELKDTSGSPPFNSDLQVDSMDITVLEKYALYMVTVAQAGKVKKIAAKVLKDLARIASVLSLAEKKAIAEDWKKIAALAEEISGLVAHPKPKLVAVN